MSESSEDIPDVDMDIEPSFLDTAAKVCVEKWEDKMKEGILSNIHFKEHWRTWVPRLYSPTQNENYLDWTYDEEKARKILFNTLEQFICNGDPTEILANINQLDKPPSVCGRVFKVGEPTYSCRECGMDSTCVLCVECFKQSEHRNHKYKMGTSSGGGCCDCGDTEAWKKAPFCDIHLAGTNVPPEERLGLPEDMAERVRVTFYAVLTYCYHLLTLEHAPCVPVDLCINDDDDDVHTIFDVDTYCTVLYNDESHTFEQVINTLTRVIKCNQKVAIEFVTNIDREGRAVVRCAKFVQCNDVKAEIEKYTSRHGNKPLKVLVVHSHVIAHQVFAMKLLTWMQVFLSNGEEFRKLFTEVTLKLDGINPSLIDGILLRDIQMWKSARSHWHRLLISGMLMEYSSKKALAEVFTRKYGTIMKEFIRDDHDHSFSVTSLSVQIFTVPTLAHHLIAKEDALYVILNTFISECNRKLNKDGRLEFERNVSNGMFRRSQYMLYDLRYLLCSVPEKWTDALRKGFLQGLSLMLNLLTMMQGMDAVLRQVGQHMEYEPEWESAFNLHIKLAFCISLALEWCGTDRVVLVKAYRATLKKLAENPCPGIRVNGEVQEVANHSVACFPYEVASKPVSIHLPLSRFLAGLHLHLENMGMNFHGPEFLIAKPSPEEIIEPVLRTQAMISQVHAGMWRRNGYALLNQLFFYHNVKCRTEMLDRDIVLLQMGASIIESNEFLIHILNRFNLIHWAHPDFEINTLKNLEEDNMRQTIYLIEEFLQLMIVVIGERYMPGIGKVTAEDRIKKEIIQQLCIRPLPHSELNKTLPDDITHEMVLDDIINEVATFKKPIHGSGKGVYELKPEFYKEYNVFFYHYTREELSKSEEEQRQRRKAAGELECCPPPMLPELKESFSMIVNLLQCDVMLHIMQTILMRSSNLRARSFSEPQLHKVLHLIGYALQEEQSQRYPIVMFTERAQKLGILEYMEELSSSPRVEAHKDLLKWTINKYKQVIAFETELVIDQPSSSTSDELSAKDEKERRSRLAAQKRAKLMAQMTQMQNTFMKENANLFEETDVETDPNDTSMDITEYSDLHSVALGPKQTSKLSCEITYTCILCQELQKVTTDGPVLVLAAFVQQATVLCPVKLYVDENKLKKDEHLFLGSNLGPAPHTSTCGHVMHSVCWQKYFDNAVMKEHRRPYRNRHPASFDVEKQEFLCPLCECLSNTVLPLIPPLGMLQMQHCGVNNITYENWLRALKQTVEEKISVCHGVFKCNNGTCQCEGLIKTECGPEGEGSNSCDATCNAQSHLQFIPCSMERLQQTLDPDCMPFINLFQSNEAPEFSTNLKDMIDHYALTVYTRGLGLNQNLTDKRVPLLIWKSCAYTIHTIEVLLRDMNKPLLGDLTSRHRDCLESLIRIIGVFGITWRLNSVMSNHIIKLLYYILEQPEEGPSILEWDSLGILIPLTMSIRNLFNSDYPVPVPDGKLMDLYVFRLIFASHIIKVLITTDLNTLDTSMDIDPEKEQECGIIVNILKSLNKYRENLNVHAIWKHIQFACMPFLRSCVLFYHYLTEVPAPANFTEPNGETFNTICEYLGVADSCNELIGSSELQQVILKWCSHKTVKEYLNGNNELRIVPEPLKINRLVQLPNDYSELINSVSLFTCPNSDREDSRNPTMCLVCGEMLCSQSYCCQMELNKTMVGACTYHAHECGAGVGVFLRVRECEILFLASPMRGCFISPPYLDDYGETDQGLRRGNPLHLCSEKYKKLHTLWMSHGIQEEIARAIESSSNIMSTQWQHL